MIFAIVYFTFVAITVGTLYSYFKYKNIELERFNRYGEKLKPRDDLEEYQKWILVFGSLLWPFSLVVAGAIFGFRYLLKTLEKEKKEEK